MEYVCSTSDSSIFPLAPGLTGTPTWATHSDTARRARRPHRRRAGQSRAAGREAGGGISSSGRPQQGGAERAPAHSSPNAASATILPGRGRSRAGRKAAPRCLRGTSGPAGRARGGSDRVVPQPLPRMCEVAAAAPARGSRAGGVSGGAARRSPRELQGAFI